MTIMYLRRCNEDDEWTVDKTAPSHITVCWLSPSITRVRLCRRRSELLAANKQNDGNQQNGKTQHGNKNVDISQPHAADPGR